MPDSEPQRATTRPWAVRAGNTRRNDPDAPDAPRTRKKGARGLECSLCPGRYSREDVLSGLYQITTKVCSPCYARMQAAPHKACCFGKPDVVLPDGSRLRGYSRTARECQELCPDRALCASVADPASYNPADAD